jgi:hypothetical protein
VWRNLFPLVGRRRDDEKPWLFEMLAHNLSRELRRGRDFLDYIVHNPLKRLDSQK